MLAPSRLVLFLLQTGDRSTARVLVVDDRPDVRLSLKLMLEASGFDCLEAADGDGAIDVLRQTRVDVVLTDLLMPGTNGGLLIRALRQWIPQRPRIIAMTGADYTEREPVILAAVAEGADTILVKPFSLNQLLDVIRKKCTPAQRLNL